MITWGEVIAFGLGLVTSPFLIFAVVVVVDHARHGRWRSLDELCDHPKDGRTMLPGRVHSTPEHGWWPFVRCPVCGSRWVRGYVASLPGAGPVLRLLWRRAPEYTADEIEARWEVYTDEHTPTEAQARRWRQMMGGQR